jgi:hypothetical protein
VPSTDAFGMFVPRMVRLTAPESTRRRSQARDRGDGSTEKVRKRRRKRGFPFDGDRGNRLERSSFSLPARGNSPRDRPTRRRGPKKKGRIAPAPDRRREPFSVLDPCPRNPLRDPRADPTSRSPGKSRCHVGNRDSFHDPDRSIFRSSFRIPCCRWSGSGPNKIFCPSSLALLAG